MNIEQFVIPSQVKNQTPVLPLVIVSTVEPTVPANAPMQEIWFEPPPSNGQSRADEGIVIDFVIADPHVEIRMRQAVHTAYALYGRTGLSHLMQAIQGNPFRPWGLKGEQSLVSRQNTLLPAPGRSKLGNQFLKERDSLDKVLKATRHKVEETAWYVATARLEISQAQVLTETKRYLSLANKRDETAIAALESDTLAWPLTGPDLVPLAEALSRIDEQRMPVQKAEALLERASRPLLDKRLAYGKEKLQSSYSVRGNDLTDLTKTIEVALEAVEAYPASPEMIAAQQLVTEKRAELAVALAAEAFNFPILYRLWRPNLAGAISHVLASFRSTNLTQQQKQRALMGVFEFRVAILATLRRAWRAAHRSQMRIVEKSLNIWRYPPLVYEALRRLAVPPGTVEWQTAYEQMREEKEGVNPLSAISTTAGFLEAGVTVAGVAAAMPAVTTVVSLVSLLLSVAELIQEALQVQEQRDAFDSSLNPSRSFAEEASYIGLLVDLAFIVFSIDDVVKPTRAALKSVP